MAIIHDVEKERILVRWNSVAEERTGEPGEGGLK